MVVGVEREVIDVIYIESVIEGFPNLDLQNQLVTCAFIQLYCQILL